LKVFSEKLSRELLISYWGRDGSNSIIFLKDGLQKRVSQSFHNYSKKIIAIFKKSVFKCHYAKTRALTKLIFRITRANSNISQFFSTSEQEFSLLIYFKMTILKKKVENLLNSKYAKLWNFESKGHSLDIKKKVLSKIIDA